MIESKHSTREYAIKTARKFGNTVLRGRIDEIEAALTGSYSATQIAFGEKK